MDWSDRAASYIRTWWPLFLGHVAALLVTFIAAKFGVHIDSALAFEAVGFAAAALVYWLGRNLENASNPYVRGLGHFIMSLGLATTQPTYNQPQVPQRPPVEPTTIEEQS